MLFRNFAHWLFVGFAVFAVIVFTVLLVGLGTFGPKGQTALLSLAKEIDGYYSQHKPIFDWTFTIFGVAGSATTGAFAVYKSWYYAEMNLPVRLVELIERQKRSLFEARPALLASINDAVVERFPQRPLIYHFPLFRLLRERRLGRARDAAVNLMNAIELNKKELLTVARRKEEIEQEIVAGHLLRGTALAADASMLPSNSITRRAKNEEALLEFQAALDLLPEDLDALMLFAKQSALLGDDGTAVDRLDKMAHFATKSGSTIRAAQALRLKADILAKRDKLRDWDDARRSALAAVELLDGLEETTAQKLMELIKALIVLGVVQTKREKFTAARRDALDRARDLLMRLGLHVSTEVKQALDDAYAQLENAENDKEEPGE